MPVEVQRISLTYIVIQSILSGTTTLDVKEKWSFQTGGHFRQVQFAWNLDRTFHKLENGLSRERGLSRRGRSRQVLLYRRGRGCHLVMDTHLASHAQ